ncbi:MAG TPA: TrmH family RNA methyltransferase [Spirochaetia bacterium]|nr:TrmH family RNA methyltransferase [Spirochaetia bacterium]
MYPLGKLSELSRRTRQRKVARILQGMEVDLGGGRPCDFGYLAELLALLDADAPRISHDARTIAEELSRPGGPDSAGVLRGLNVLRNDLLHEIRAEPAEWDLVNPQTGLLDRTGVKVFPLRVFLEDLRSPFNVGSIFRTAEAFGVERVFLSPRTPLPTHPRASKTAMNAERSLPWEVRELDTLRAEEGLFALELGGTPIDRFSFPPRGTVLVGSEELGLSPEALRLADQALGRVSIPLAGAKRSLNVAVAFGILMEAWRAGLERP